MKHRILKWVKMISSVFSSTYEEKRKEKMALYYLCAHGITVNTNYKTLTKTQVLLGSVSVSKDHVIVRYLVNRTRFISQQPIATIS